MQNLSIAELNEHKFDVDGLPITATTFDASSGDLICALGPTPSRPVIELKRCPAGLGSYDGDLITSWDAPCPLEDLECDEILSLHYFHESSAICLVLAGGDFILVRENPQGDQERIEIVGSIEVGISAAQWSRNANFLAIVTGAGAFVLMSQLLEAVNETILQEDDLNLSKHVSVGWGKKETQFQGKRAKAMRDPTMPDSVDEGKPSPNDDGKTTISWRGDGAYVAVNSTIASSRRVIRVYSAGGVLDSVSEPVDGLESSISWRPYGNLIAGVKRSTERLEIVFFERNGLRHGGFELRLTEEQMASFGAKVMVRWNCDSTILAVKLLDRVQLWTMGNYHYYLKQEIRLRRLERCKWHAHDPLRLAMSSPYLAQSLALELKVDRGSTCVPYDYGLVAVIDGHKLKVTPLKYVNVPPPMAFIELEADDNIISCSISKTCQRMAILTHSHVYLCTWQMRQAGKDTIAMRHSTQYHMEKRYVPDHFRSRATQLTILNDDNIYILAPARSTLPQDKAICRKYIWIATIEHSVELPTLEVDVSEDVRQLVSDTTQGAIWGLSGSGMIPLTGSEFFESGAETSSTHVATMPRTQAEHGTHIAVAVSKLQELTIDGVQKAVQCTSLAVTDAYIVFTTSNHLLKFVHLGTDLTIPGDTPEVDERCRAIERGAQIVTVIPSIYAVVLQMPRGNLETIYPRILVLAGIRNHIRNLEYREAFIACQTHQVDLNILYDLNPQALTTNISLFIDQLNTPSRVDEFIQRLKEEDVTKTLYRDTSITDTAQVNVHVAPPTSNKVNSICDPLIAALQKRSSAYQQNVITAYVCKRPPDLNAALTLVSSLLQSSQEEADLAVAHLCFLTDTNRLFDAALALYDLELTLLVAQNAQRDPREYMPFLQSLQALPVLRRRYTIDNHLKKFAKALVSLHALEEHDELEAYTVKHVLYMTAIDLYKHSPEQLAKVSRLYADYLSTQSQHAAAATLYESLGDNESAYPLYALAHQWRESLTCACLVPLPQDKLETLARSLATSCTEESRDHRSAATIHLEYLSEPLIAAELLCKASYFGEATRLLSFPSRGLAEKIPTIIDPMLTKKFGEIIELIADCQTQLASQVPRVEELRIKKTEDPLAFFGGDAAIGAGVDIPDNVSLAPTDASTLGGQSMFTRYGRSGSTSSEASTKFAGTVASNVSRKTSKTKRREERKRARGKKGSVYEEEYLVSSVARLIERVNGAHDEVRRLLSGLQRRGLREQASKIEEIMASIHAACEAARKRLWKVEEQMNLETGTYDVDGQGRPSGADGVLYDSQTDMQTQQKPPPEVKLWKGDKYVGV